MRVRRWSARDAQIEPLAALAAVAVVAIAFTAYAGVLETSIPEGSDRAVAEDAADRVERSLTTGGVVRPKRLSSTRARGPEGYQVNITLVADGKAMATGPAAPATADVARRRVSVRERPGRVSPGRLEVRVWT